MEYHPEGSEDEIVTFNQKKAKFSRRTQEEIAIGFVVHLLMLFYWVFVHVYDATVVKSLSTEARKIAFPAYEEPLGRWKFLTYINLVRNYHDAIAYWCSTVVLFDIFLPGIFY